MYDPNRLIALIREKALKLGKVTLASGKEADYYLDCRKIVLDPQGAKLVAAGMLDRLVEDPPDLVGGLAIGADPITGGIVTLAGIREVPLRGLMVRKEPKRHGTKQFVEGPYEAGERVVVVEDVVTSGGSALTAARRCRDAGLQVVGALAIVDRLEGGGDAFAAEGIPFTPLLTVRDLGIEPS